MIAALILVSLVALFGLSLPRLLRPMAPAPPDRSPGAPDDAEPPSYSAYPESMTAELDPWDEEYLAWLADDLWPDDEYAEFDHSTDGEEGTGGNKRR